MPDDQTTRTDLGASLGRAEMPRVLILTVAYHPEPRSLGTRCVLSDGEDLVLGRACSAFGPDVLRDSLMSRQHARVTRRGDEITLHDLGSHNGTFVDGERITRRRLEPGAVIGVGSVLLLLHHGPLLHRPAPNPVLIGVSSALSEVVEQIEQVASEPVCVLVQGQSGAGKELVASEIHRLSGVPGPFVAVNCGALADGVVHSELFGHTRGAFSGAEGERRGVVALAAGGTLFLDEIADASPSLQASLLRLLEQREYRPVGGDRLLRTDARFVAATHVPLEPAVEASRFRRDLYGRLRRWVIRVPALHERREDIVPLALHFADKAARRTIRLSRELGLALLRYPWPNNVRELAAVIERAVLEAGPSEELGLTTRLAERLAAARPVGPDHGPPPPLERPLATADAPGGTTATADRASDGGESASPAPVARPSPEQLCAQLAAVGHNIRALADALGISRRTAYRWLEDAAVDLQAIRDANRRG